MPLPALAAVAIKAIPWIVGLIGGVYATKKVTGAFGSTPANDIKQIPGLEKTSPKQLYQDKKEWRNDRVEYHKKRNKKAQNEIDKLNKKIELENEEKTRLAAREKETNDPAEKAKIQQQLLAINKNISGLQSQVKEKEKELKDNDKKVDEIYQGFDDSLTQEQFVAESNSINWKSYKNYGIIFICIIVVIMLIGFMKKLFGSLLSSMK